jgi:hypothetical protein
VELVEVHKVVDACEQQPLAAALAPHERMLERAVFRLVSGDRSDRVGHLTTVAIQAGQ